MNTTPSIIEKVNYTVVGGRKDPTIRKGPSFISIVLLSRGGRVFRNEILTSLVKLNVYEIITIEGEGSGYDVESLSVKFPEIKFVTLRNITTEGEKINIGIEEASSKYVLVMYDDMALPAGGLSERLIERIADAGCLCTVPLLQSRKQLTVPTIISPAFMKKKLKIVHLPPSVDGMDSLFPFDYCGIYDRDRFIQLGGYDSRIAGMYWQKLDFGFRAYMWGEKIHCSTSFRIKYLDEIPQESITPDRSYRFFYLKNLTVRFTGDSGQIPAGRFLPYHFKSSEGFFTSLREFREARDWVYKNRYRFRMEAGSITEIWEAPEN